MIRQTQEAVRRVGSLLLELAVRRVGSLLRELAEPDDTEQDSVSPYTVLLEHEKFRWNAEEENSRRLSIRINLLLTSVVAFLALGLFQFGLGVFSEPMGFENEHLESLVRIFTVVGLAFFIATAIFILVARSVDSPEESDSADDEESDSADDEVQIADASRHLFLYLNTWDSLEGSDSADDEDLMTADDRPVPIAPEVLSTDYYRSLAYEVTAEAADELIYLNALERKRVSGGQVIFILGMLWFAAAIGIYTGADRKGKIDAQIQETRGELPTKEGESGKKTLQPAQEPAQEILLRPGSGEDSIRDGEGGTEPGQNLPAPHAAEPPDQQNDEETEEDN